MKVAFVGGCHLVGKPHGVQYSFVRLLWKRWRGKERDVHFDLIPYAVRWEALFEACREALNRKPAVLVVNVQAGLVLPTWERTMKRLGFGYGDNAPEATLNWFGPSAWKLDQKGKAYWMMKKAGIFLLGGHRENWQLIGDMWRELSCLFRESSTRVIVMTPTPAHPEYFLRGKANLQQVRKIIFEHSSVYEVCDVYSGLDKMGEKALWIDGQHLSKDGHLLIAEQLWEMLA